MIIRKFIGIFYLKKFTINIKFLFKPPSGGIFFLLFFKNSFVVFQRVITFRYFLSK